MERRVEYFNETDDFYYEVTITGNYTPGDQPCGYGRSFEIESVECTALDIYQDSDGLGPGQICVENEAVLKIMADWLRNNHFREPSVLEEILDKVEEEIVKERA